MIVYSTIVEIRNGLHKRTSSAVTELLTCGYSTVGYVCIVSGRYMFCMFLDKVPFYISVCELVIPTLYHWELRRDVITTMFKSLNSNLRQ